MSPFDVEPDPNRAAIIAGVLTAVAVLAALGFYIFTNQPEPVAAPPITTARPPITTLAPTATAAPGGVLPGYTAEFDSARC